MDTKLDFVSRSVGIVRVRTKATEFVSLLICFKQDYNIHSANYP